MNKDPIPPDEISDEELVELALDREPSSIRDLQYLYGGLYQMGVDRSGWPIDPAFAPHLSPNEADDLVDEPNTLVLVDISTNGGHLKPLGITATTLDSWYLHRLAYAKYDAARGADHSITQKTGENPPDKVADYQLDTLLKRWPKEDVIKTTLESWPDGWMLQSLPSIVGTDEYGALKKEIRNKLDGERRRLLTVRFTKKTEAEYGSPTGIPREDWHYPAEITAHSNALVERRKHKWATKNNANSRGEGAGYVLGSASDETYGATPDPLNLFTANKRAWLPGFDPDQVANVHPISPEAATYIEYSGIFTDAAYQKSNGGRLYHLPYFKNEQTPEKMRTLYSLLWDARMSEQEGETDGVSKIEQFHRSIDENPNVPTEQADDLAFWTLYLTYAGTATRVRAMAETRGTGIPQQLAVATESANVAASIQQSGLFSIHESMDFSNPDANQLQYTTNSSYFFNTTPAPPADEDDVNTNTLAFTFYNQFLSGTPINQHQLLKAYVEKLDNKYRNNLSDGKNHPIPTWAIVEQYAQLRTLDQSNLLNRGQKDTATDQPIYTQMTKPTTTPEQSTAEREAQAYTEFIQSHELLKNNPERRAAFTLGALVTTLANYQRSKGRSPITKRLGPKSITKQNLKTHATDLLDLVNTYGAENGQVMRYQNLTTPLADDLSHTSPPDWDLTTEDIQWHISLGMAFGAVYRGPTESDSPNNESAVTES